MLYIFFFFSSRRRHTRFDCDWSSDVCSSDLFGLPTREAISPVQVCNILGEVGAYGVNFHDNDLIPIDASPSGAEQIKKEFQIGRARVGKECRSRWAPYQ